MKTANPTPTLLRITFFALMLTPFLTFTSCSSSEQQTEGTESTDNAALFKDDGKGVGPIKEVKLADIDPKMAEEGKALFEAKCTACHKFSDQKYVGPGLKGVTKRRKPEWIENMILNPAEMTQKDPTAKDLLATHLTQMTNQNVAPEDARKILEFFRQGDSE